MYTLGISIQDILLELGTLRSSYSGETADLKMSPKHILTLIAPNKICRDDTIFLFFYLYLSKNYKASCFM